jgi:hypothetical protein
VAPDGSAAAPARGQRSEQPRWQTVRQAVPMAVMKLSPEGSTTSPDGGVAAAARRERMKTAAQQSGIDQNKEKNGLLSATCR